jgi:hypothetical protein
MRTEDESTRQAAGLMAAFGERTGLTSDRPAQRYLWTDAFAVCNFLALSRRAGDERWKELALRLVDQVHRVLGRHRPDDRRRGWLSGLGDREGEDHPTRGGLRIGKRLPERGPAEPFDERLEWDRDGQYFHYLTKWMHALEQVSGATGDPRFHLWARELADAAHRAFVHGPPGARRMVWKMSSDLSRPLVPSMGQHDPLDGFLVCLELETSAARHGGPARPSLERALAEFGALLEGSELRTTDPLGLGGLLADAGRLAQIMERGRPEWAILLESLIAAAQEGLSRYEISMELRQPASRRLAFRELGLAIALAGLEPLRDRVAKDRAELRERIRALLPKAALGSSIVSFWLDPENRRGTTWSDHREINEVMLATSLVPEGFLELAAVRV